MSYTRRNFVRPAEAQRTVAVREGNLLPQQELEQQRQRLAMRIQTNPTMASIQQDFENRHADMVATQHQPELSALYRKRLSRADDFLRLFISEVYLPLVYGNDSPFGVDDFLGDQPPRRSLARDRGFWKMLALFVTVRLVPSYTTGESRRTIRTSRAEFQALYLAYRRLTGKPVDPEVVLECHAVIEENAIEAEAPKPIATYENMVSFIKDGVFSDQLVLRCPREQVQLAAYNLVIAFCAARPSEVTEWKYKHAGMRYNQLNFYLSLWDDHEEDCEPEKPQPRGSAISKTVSTSAAASKAIAGNEANAGNEARATPSRFRLHCDVKLEKLKGHRASLAKWREQPLYSTGEEICLDPVLLLAHLAELDNAFPAGMTVASILKDTDPSYFEENRFLPIPLRPEVQDLYVFRTFDKRQTEHGSIVWEVSPDRPLQKHSVHSPLRKCARAAGLIGYKAYSLRRLTMIALDRPDIAQGSRNLAVGHGLSSTSMQKSYLSRRTTIDVQGLVSKGREETSLIVAHGIRHLKSAKLQKPGSLSIAEKQRLENLPTVQEARLANVEASASYKAAVSSGNQDAALVERLQQEKAKAHSRLTHVRTSLWQKELDQLAILAEEQNEISAFLGDGPVAAAQALVRHLQPESRANRSASTTTRQEPSHIVDAAAGVLPVALDNNSSDANDANDGRNGGELPLFLGGSDDSDDDDESEDDDASDEQSWMQELIRTEVSQRCSALLDEMAETIKEDLNDTDADASISLQPSEPTTASQQQSPRKPFLSPLDLRQRLDALQTQISTSIPLPVPDYAMLKRPARYEDMATLSDALSSSNKGTQNGAAELLDSTTEGMCTWCNKRLVDSVDSKCVTRGAVTKHVRMCTRRPAREMYRQACLETLSGKACPYYKCVSKGVEFPAEADAIKEHVDNHRRNTLLRLQNFAIRRLKTFECRLVNADPNASPCSWSFQASDQGEFDADTLFLHLETSHGFPSVVLDAVQLCEAHNRWNFGTAQIEQHHRSDAEAALLDVQRCDFFRSRLCPWCLQDETLS